MTINRCSDNPGSIEQVVTERITSPTKNDWFNVFMLICSRAGISGIHEAIIE